MNRDQVTHSERLNAIYQINIANSFYIFFITETNVRQNIWPPGDQNWRWEHEYE